MIILLMFLGSILHLESLNCLERMLSPLLRIWNALLIFYQLKMTLRTSKQEEKLLRTEEKIWRRENWNNWVPLANTWMGCQRRCQHSSSPQRCLESYLNCQRLFCQILSKLILIIWSSPIYETFFFSAYFFRVSLVFTFDRNINHCFLKIKTVWEKINSKNKQELNPEFRVFNFCNNNLLSLQKSVQDFCS